MRNRVRVSMSIFAATVVMFGDLTAATAELDRFGALTSLRPSRFAARGEWSAPFSEGGLFDERPPANKKEAAMLPTAASIAVSPDGTIVYWNGFEDSENLNPSIGLDHPDKANSVRVLDVRGYVKDAATKPIWSTPAQERGIGGDLFCSDLRTLSDGRLLVVGGTRFSNEDRSLGLPNGMGRTEIWGLDEARIYDPASRSWTAAAPMRHKRWYPSLISLPQGKLLVAGGIERAVYHTKGYYVNETETFDPRTGRWADNGQSGDATLPYYARLHLLPTGKVFYDASGQMWGPGGSTLDMAEWNMQKLYDPTANEWTDAGLAPLGARSGTFSAMLPLKPPYDRAKIVVGGGTLGPATPGAYVANDLTELIDIEGDKVERKVGPSLNNDRWYSSGVVLPSGEVVAVSGADKDDTVLPGTAKAVLQAEMFDGTRWVPLASATRERAYHNTAILLGDGSVLVGGHATMPALHGPGHANYAPGVFSTNFRDPSFEIFKPPYLFRGPRPRLTRVQAGVELGDTFKITTPDASEITSVVLSRLPAVTHLSDTDQRTVELEFTRKGHRTIEASTPGDPAVLLSGHYYLFLMSDNGEGPTPSRAAIVQIGATDREPAPQPFGR